MDNGGSAFPQHGWSSSPAIQEQMAKQGGMTLLDYFAGQALAGLCANSDIVWPKSGNDHAAAFAYALAAAMLAERERAK